MSAMPATARPKRTSVTGYYTILAVLFLAVQGSFWWVSAGRLPDLGVVPELASEQELDVLSFGDRQLLFRIMAFRLNNTGDTFGRFTRLASYNMEKVYLWFTMLDKFDNKSNHLPSMSAYYFSQTQNEKDVIHLVNYLYEHSYWRPEVKWWWLGQATYLALHKLKDEDLALKIAKHLEGVKGIPYWAQQMPAFVYEKRGEFEDAYIIMRNILETDQEMDQGELNYMRYFMEERLERLKEAEELLKKQQERIDRKSKETGVISPVVPMVTTPSTPKPEKTEEQPQPADAHQAP